MGQPELRGADHEGDREQPGWKADPLANIRLDDQERALLQEEGRQQLFRGVEGDVITLIICLHAFCFLLCSLIKGLRRKF